MVAPQYCGAMGAVGRLRVQQHNGMIGRRYEFAAERLRKLRYVVEGKVCRIDGSNRSVIARLQWQRLMRAAALLWRNGDGCGGSGWGGWRRSSGAMVAAAVAAAEMEWLRCGKKTATGCVRMKRCERLARMPTWGLRAASRSCE